MLGCETGHPGVRCSQTWGERTGRRTKHEDTPECSLCRCLQEAIPAEHVPSLLQLLVVAAGHTGAHQVGPYACSSGLLGGHNIYLLISQ